jgi:oligosaccharide 4-alpha-D-glucosyltransferase
MTPRTSLATVLFAVPMLAVAIAEAQNADRHLERYSTKRGQLEIVTNDGRYLIKAFNSSTVETTFIPTGQSFDTDSHAVVLQSSLQATVKEVPGGIRFETPGIAVNVSRSPFQITYSYKGNELVAEQNGYQLVDNLESIDFQLQPGEALYGGGFRALGMNRRGHRLALYNKAQFGYGARVGQTSFTMPLVISSKHYMMHFDNSASGYLDLDSRNENVLSYQTTQGRKTYQVVAGETWEELIGRYTELTGRQPLPPRWALGNFASRFGYHSEQEAREVVARFQAADIPLDAIIFDVYWFGRQMTGTMGNLTFESSAFPDPRKMIADFAAQGIKTVLITEPFVLTTSSRWNEALENQVITPDQTGAPYTYDFYFGHTGLIDIFNARAKPWFWGIYRNLHELGVRGVWGDLGEPEVHPAVLQHSAGPQQLVHNIYGHEWARLVYEGYRRDYPNERPFILMRAGYSGSQRFGLIPWSGDVSRTWSGLQSQPEIALQMGMQGLAYMHSDLGGFAGSTVDDELYTRWLQYGIFQPIFRPHAQEEIPPEPVFRGENARLAARESIRLRYEMLPYNYTLAFDNSRTGMPLMRPLMYEEPAKQQLWDTSVSYLWGHDFLVTPILQAGTTAKQIYFPAPSAWFDFYTGARHAGGTAEEIPVTPEHIPVYVRAGAFIPLAPVFRNTHEYSTKHIDLHYYHDSSVPASSGKLYDDDGETAGAYDKGEFEMLSFASQLHGTELTITLGSQVGRHYHARSRDYTLYVHNIDSRPRQVRVDRHPSDFVWDEDSRLLTVQIPAPRVPTSRVLLRMH